MKLTHTLCMTEFTINVNSREFVKKIYKKQFQIQIKWSEFTQNVNKIEFTIKCY